VARVLPAPACEPGRALTPQPRVNPSSASAHKFVTTTTCVAVERLALIKLDGETATPLIVTAGSDGRLRLWSASAAQLLHVLPLTPCSLRLAMQERAIKQMDVLGQDARSAQNAPGLQGVHHCVPGARGIEQLSALLRAHLIEPPPPTPRPPHGFRQRLGGRRGTHLC
jgi:hypothetical protein